MEVTQRRRNVGNAASENGSNSDSEKRQSNDGYDSDDDSKSRRLKLTILEEVLLLGLKDQKVPFHFSFN